MSNILTQYKTNPQRHLFGDIMPFILVALVFLITGMAAVRFYRMVFTPNIDLKGESSVLVYIPSGSDFRAVEKLLVSKGYLRNSSSFEFTSRRMNYTTHVKAGRYLISDGMSSRQLVGLLRSGRQEPVQVKFQNVRTREELAGKLGRQLEPDSLKFIRLFNDSAFLARYGFTRATLFSAFIPNTYEIYWNTSAAQLFKRMYREYKSFWDGKRRKKCDSLGYTIAEVVTLASIIEKETARDDEKQVMAGVYINRLQKHIPLQADPTVIFAWNDYTIRRVYRRHTEINSPYNTYKFVGLPPGPICIPSIASIDAVLNYIPGKYLYFCAKEDLSGYHNFAATLGEHNRNAKKYQEAMDKLNIR